VTPSIEDSQKKTRVVADELACSNDAAMLQRSNSELNNGAKPIIYVRGESIRLTTQNPFTVSRDIQKSFGAVSRIECRGASLTITCISEYQKEKILRSTQLGDVAIITSLHYTERRKQQETTQPRHQRVVITGVPMGIDDSAVMTETGAIEIHHIYKRGSSGIKEPTTALVLSYNCSTEEVPSRVQIGYLTFKTRTYIPLVTRCYKCQKYGHIAANCRKENHTCPICAGPHRYEECQTKDSKKCANCDGAHSASFRECLKYVVAKQVTYRAATHHMSYQDAVIQIREEQRSQEQRHITLQQPQETTETSLTLSMSQQGTSTVLRKQSEAGSTKSHPVLTSEKASEALEAESVPRQDRSTEISTSETLTGYISDKDLYQLLAMIIKLLESQVSKSTFICGIVDYVSSKLNRSSEAINQNIHYYATESSLSTQSKLPTLTRTNQSSSSNAMMPS